jgi:hypothetical protein
MKRIVVYILTIAVLALFAGGAIIVLFILLPFWQSLEPHSLMEWFQNFGGITGITMMPMEIISLLFSMYSYLLAKKSKEEGKNLWLLVNASNILILVLFFIYFLPINISFAKETINPNTIAAELVRWKIIHAGRTVLTLVSTALAIVAFLKMYRNIVLIKQRNDT